jgi:hypothetical protein
MPCISRSVIYLFAFNLLIFHATLLITHTIASNAKYFTIGWIIDPDDILRHCFICIVYKVSNVMMAMKEADVNCIMQV